MATAAVNPGNPVQALNVGGPQLSSTAAAVGAMNAGAVSDGTADRTMAAVMKMGETILAPQLDAARKEQFASGVQRAATGEALEDILKDQPAWTQIFGTTAAIDGARAYTAQAKIGEFGATMEKEMPALAKLPPEALSKRAADHMAGMMTGDPMTDAAIQMAYVEQLQPLMKRHAKESYKFQQGEAARAQVGAWDSLMDAYQSRWKAANDGSGTFTQEDMVAETDRLIGALQPFADQSPDSFEKGIINAVQGAATKGNFAAIKALEDKGIFGALEPDTQAKLTGYLSTAAKGALNQAMPTYALDVAMLVNDTAQNPAKVPERIAALNAKVAREQGISEKYAQLIPSSTVDNVIGNVLRAQAAEANREHKLTPEEERAQQLAMANSQLSIPGAIGRATAIGRIPAGVAEEAADAQWQANAQNPQAQAAILNARGSGSYTTIKEQLAAMGFQAGDKDSKGTQHVAQVYRNLNEGTKAAYFDQNERDFYDRYNNSINAGVPGEAAYLSAKVAMPLARDMIPEKDKTEVGKAIRAEAERRNSNFFGWNSVDDQSLRVIEAYMAHDYRKNRQTTSTQVAVARSLTTALANGLDIVGKHAVLGNQPGQRSLVQIMSQGRNNQGASETAKRFTAVLEQKAKAVGGTMDDYTIIRSPDVNGEARYLVQMWDKDGNDRIAVIGSEDLRDYKESPSVVDEMGGGAAFGRFPRSGPVKE